MDSRAHGMQVQKEIVMTLVASKSMQTSASQLWMPAVRAVGAVRAVYAVLYCAYMRLCAHGCECASGWFGIGLFAVVLL